MRGLETVRLILPHTIPLNIVIHVAQTLDERVRSIIYIVDLTQVIISYKICLK